MKFLKIRDELWSVGAITYVAIFAEDYSVVITFGRFERVVDLSLIKFEQLLTEFCSGETVVWEVSVNKKSD